MEKQCSFYRDPEYTIPGPDAIKVVGTGSVTYVDQDKLTRHTPYGVFVEERNREGGFTPAHINPMLITFTTAAGRAALTDLAKRLAAAIKAPKPALGLRLHVNPKAKKAVEFISARV